MIRLGQCLGQQLQVTRHGIPQRHPFLLDELRHCPQVTQVLRFRQYQGTTHRQRAENIVNRQVEIQSR